MGGGYFKASMSPLGVALRSQKQPLKNVKISFSDDIFFQKKKKSNPKSDEVLGKMGGGDEKSGFGGGGITARIELVLKDRKGFWVTRNNLGVTPDTQVLMRCRDVHQEGWRRMSHSALHVDSFWSLIIIHITHPFYFVLFL